MAPGNGDTRERENGKSGTIIVPAKRAAIPQELSNLLVARGGYALKESNRSIEAK